MRRRGRSPTTHPGTNTPAEFLDRDDQDVIVKSIEDEALEQTRRFRTFFWYIGAFALLGSIAYPFLSYEECSTQWPVCFSHSFLSVVAHGCSIALGQQDDSSSPYSASTFGKVCLALIGSTILFWTSGATKEEADHYHLSLIFGNIVTFLGAALLRWDMENTLKDIRELDSAKYDHKTL